MVDWFIEGPINCIGSSHDFSLIETLHKSAKLHKSQQNQFQQNRTYNFQTNIKFPKIVSSILPLCTIALKLGHAGIVDPSVNYINTSVDNRIASKLEERGTHTRDGVVFSFYTWAVFPDDVALMFITLNSWQNQVCIKLDTCTRCLVGRGYGKLYNRLWSINNKYQNRVKSL